MLMNDGDNVELSGGPGSYLGTINNKGLRSCMMRTHRRSRSWEGEKSRGRGWWVAEVENDST